MGQTKGFVLLIVCSFPWLLNAQIDTNQQLDLEPIVISGNRFSEKKKNVAQKIDIIGLKELKRLNAPTMADVLIQSGKVFVQKSQQGGGSPVIRGFEASRVLLMVDGIRLNNAIYRSGHLQNVITIDNNMLQRVEILNGPASTIYGSDALGGVVSMQTKNPKLSQEKRLGLTQAQAVMRYATANQEKMINTGFSLGSKKWGTLTNITLSDFDDLRQGAWDNNNQLALWGRDFFVQRINGIDSVVQNDNRLDQKFSGYSQVDILQKVTYQPNLNNRHLLNVQFSTTSDIPRYDRLTQTSNGLPRHAEWFYGPQRRLMTAYHYDYVGKKKYYDEVNFNVSYQNITESRNTRRFRDDFLAERVEKLNVYGLNIAARKKIKKHEITYGGDAQINVLNSQANAQYVGGVLSPPPAPIIETRYPDGDNNMNLYGAFVQHLVKWKKGKWVLNDGIRFNATRLHSTIENNVFNLPFTEINETNTAITGNIGIIHFPHKKIRLSANASRGFRAPNIDDLGKVFDSFSGEMLVVPNDNLNPEYTNSIDLALQYQDKKFYLNVYGFYTQFQNAIVLDEFSFNGQDTIMYNGLPTKVFANQNKAEAFLLGAGMETKIKLSKQFLFAANTAITYGRFKEDDRLIPLDHVPPIYGRAALRYTQKKWYVETFLLFNGDKNIIHYNPNGEDNQQFALANGTPAWYTINLRTNYNINEHFSGQIGVDNFLDKNYRHFASGISAPGRNLIFSLRYNY